MPYHIGAKGSNGCSGYPVISDKGHVAGCHETESEATAQLGALYANVADATKGEASIETSTVSENPSESINPAVGIKKPQYMNTNQARPTGSGIHNKPGVEIWAGSAFGKSDAPMPENPIMPTQTYEGCECDMCAEQEISCANCPKCSGLDAETQMAMYDSSIGKASPCWDGYVQRGMKDQDGKMVPNCIPVEKADSILFSAKDYTKQTRTDRLFR